MAAGLTLLQGGRAGAADPSDAERAFAVPLPPLREELALHPGPRGADGAPSWTMEDPARARYFRIGPLEMELLARWHLETPRAIADAVRAETLLRPTPQDVLDLARFLAGANLLRACGPEAVARLQEQMAATRPGWASWLLHNYLFVRIPLLRPDRFLAAAMPHVDFLFRPGFWLATLAAGLLGLLLAARQWDAFVHTFLHFFSLEGAALAGLTLVFCKVVHEFGHAFTAKRCGCRVATMGVALLVLWPTAYTDTSGAWTLPDRRRRLAIGVAGMAAELALAAWATLLWSFLPDGMLRSAVFMIATTTWILTLAVNLNPLMRFDGYYLLADALDIANLQDRAFRLARWHLRETLFGFGEPRPEALPRRMQRFLIGFGYATWVYRFFLFLGIAVLVYHVFFKLLGILLFLVEIAWFIARPIRDELKAWAERRERYRLNRHTAASMAGLGLLLLLVLVPWRGSVLAPALLRAEQQVQLYAPHGARLEDVLASPGTRVAAGQPLYRFAAPDLAHELRQVEREIVRLRWQSSFLLMDREAVAHIPVVRQQLEAALAKRVGLLRQRETLVVTAPFAGLLVEQADPLAPGEWVAAGEWLGTLVSPERLMVEAYVAEADLGRLGPGATAVFHSEDPARPRVAATVSQLATTATRSLTAAPELASLHGGGIASLAGAKGAPVPEQAVYKVLLSPTDPAAGRPGATPLAERGTVAIEGEARSLAGRLWTQMVAVLVRESGF